MINKTPVPLCIVECRDVTPKHLALPDWVLQMPRIFQSSRGFLKSLPKKQAPEETKRRKPLKRRTASNIKERIYNWSLKGKLTSEDGTKVRIIDFLIPMKAILMQLVVDLARAGRYLGNNKIILNTMKKLHEWQQKALSMIRNQEYWWPDGQMFLGSRLDILHLEHINVMYSVLTRLHSEEIPPKHD
jgi:hypothetical protein